jgi:hypothetical protein
MPYIRPDRRKKLDDECAEFPLTAGELNFVITTIVNSYRHQQGLNYQTINDILGALEGAKLEFYRRVVAQYEDGKIQENGDVY